MSARFHIGLHDAAEIGHAVLNAARRYTISPLLLLAVIAVESNLDRFAVSVVGAKGLMQVLPSQHRDRVLRTSDLTDARTNVRIGAAILQDYIRASDGVIVLLVQKMAVAGRRAACGKALQVGESR